MEIRTKYQYTYFLEPFIMDSKKYDNYIYNLLDNKRYNFKIFNKDTNFDVYNYFSNSNKEFIFPTFAWEKEEIKEFIKGSTLKKQKMIQDFPCLIFEYNIGQNIQGKIGDEGGTFFKIVKIEIICFKPNICFINIKTHVEDSDLLSDIMKFNQQFENVKINLDTKIKIQVDEFSEMKNITDILKDITGEYGIPYKKLDSKLFSYSYICIDSLHWNEQKQFDNIENEFKQFFTNEQPDLYTNWKYTVYGFSKLRGMLFTSGIEPFYFTHLPYKYETIYLYLMILAFYQRIMVGEIPEERIFFCDKMSTSSNTNNIMQMWLDTFGV